MALEALPEQKQERYSEGLLPQKVSDLMGFNCFWQEIRSIETVEEIADRAGFIRCLRC